MYAKNPEKIPHRRGPWVRFAPNTGIAGEGDGPDTISQAVQSIWYIRHGNARRNNSSEANGPSGGSEPSARRGLVRCVTALVPELILAMMNMTMMVRITHLAMMMTLMVMTILGLVMTLDLTMSQRRTLLT